MKPTFFLRRLSPHGALLCAAVFSWTAVPRAHAQNPGDQDPTYTVGSDASGFVYAVAVQGDGQAILGGSFSTFQGAGCNCVARVHTDGSLDAFNPGLAIGNPPGSTAVVRAVAVQGNGKIVAAGSFTVLNQPANGGVVRLNADGSLDSSFAVGTGVADDGDAVGAAYTLNVLPNGQILVGGAFRSFNGVATAGLVRLNADGSVDRSFNGGGAGIAATSYGQAVRAVTVQGDGRIVIGGYFSAYDGVSANGVARLDANGTLDTSFAVGVGTQEGVLSVAVQADGKVLAGGGYTSFDGLNGAQPLLRLNANGSLDTSFSPSGNLTINEADSLIVQPDGSILVGGYLSTNGGLISSPVNGIARYSSSGVRDTSFTAYSKGLQVHALALQSDGKALAASDPTQLVGNPSGNLYRYEDLVLPTFFAGEVSLGQGAYYLSFSNGNVFGYYSFLSDPHYVYHFDLGYEYVFDAADGRAGVYLYDFASSTFFYTSPTFPFPYLYDFSLNTVLYYYPDPNNPERYNTNGVRYFYNFATGQIITK